MNDDRKIEGEIAMLDGSSIRAAREAKGMSQADLAEKIGTVQQTIDKIENGKIARTSYLPEIYQVLGIGGKETVGAGLNRRRLQTGLSMDELARKMGLAGQSSIQRYLVPDYDLELRPDIARKFDAALGEAGLDLTARIERAFFFAGYTSRERDHILRILEINDLEIAATGVGAEAIDDPLAFVREILARREMSPGGLAIEADISPSTLTRALNDPNHKFKLSVTTLQKIREWDRSHG